MYKYFAVISLGKFRGQEDERGRRRHCRHRRPTLGFVRHRHHVWTNNASLPHSIFSRFLIGEPHACRHCQTSSSSNNSQARTRKTPLSHRSTRTVQDGVGDRDEIETRCDGGENSHDTGATGRTQMPKSHRDRHCIWLLRSFAGRFSVRTPIDGATVARPGPYGQVRSVRHTRHPSSDRPPQSYPHLRLPSPTSAMLVG